MSGVSPEAVDQYLTDELANLEAQLSAIYPPERVKAIIHELLKGYWRGALGLSGSSGNALIAKLKDS